MKKIWYAAIIPAALAAAAAAVAVTLLAVKFLWSWLIPDLFPGAVEQGLVAAEISWLTAFKIALVSGIIAGLARGSTHTER